MSGEGAAVSPPIFDVTELELREEARGDGGSRRCAEAKVSNQRFAAGTYELDVNPGHGYGGADKRTD